MAQNLLRVYRRLLVEILDDLATFYQGKAYIADGVRVERKEGVYAVNEALEYVKGLDDLKPLYWNKHMHKAVSRHLKDLARNDLTGH